MSRHRHCEYCGFDFEPKQAWDKHCSDQCIKDGEMQKPKPSTPSIAQMPDKIMPDGTLSIPANGEWHCLYCGKLLQQGGPPHFHQWTSTGSGPFYGRT